MTTGLTIGENQTKIALLLGKDKTTISRSLNSLEKKELITRKSDIKNDKVLVNFQPYICRFL